MHPNWLSAANPGAMQASTSNPDAGAPALRRSSRPQARVYPDGEQALAAPGTQYDDQVFVMDPEPSVPTKSKRGPKPRADAEERRKLQRRKAQQTFREKKNGHIKMLEETVANMPQDMRSAFLILSDLLEQNKQLSQEVGSEPIALDLESFLKNTGLEDLMKIYGPGAPPAEASPQQERAIALPPLQIDRTFNSDFNPDSLPTSPASTTSSSYSATAPTNVTQDQYFPYFPTATPFESNPIVLPQADHYAPEEDYGYPGQQYDALHPTWPGFDPYEGQYFQQQQQQQQAHPQSQQPQPQQIWPFYQQQQNYGHPGPQEPQ